MFWPQSNLITQNNCDKISQSLRFCCDSSFLTLIWDSSSAFLEAGGSLMSYVFQEKAFRVANWKHFWALSCSLVGRLLDNVASGWVFAHGPVSFQGAPQEEVVSHLFTAARTQKRWVSLVSWDCSKAKDHLSWPKTFVQRITLKEYMHCGSCKRMWGWVKTDPMWGNTFPARTKRKHHFWGALNNNQFALLLNNKGPEHNNLCEPGCTAERSHHLQYEQVHFLRFWSAGRARLHKAET